ncbi:hypothetical protein BMS3Bbin09_00105 [bacterium BMS3Bbin09]|nr:hypothetical protein BMS3Bbin09_00105 [bacterium BMS3Bbin09]
MNLGSLEYGSFVIGSIILHIRLSVGYFLNGSMIAVEGSGTMSISDELMAHHPLMDEPSKPSPSSKVDSSSSLIGCEKFCQIPGKSINL